MKATLTYLFLAVMLIACATAYGQKPNTPAGKPGSADQVDTRIDNMGYWMKKAEQGLVPYNPQVTIPPPVYKGSLIQARGVRITDSPDIPVTILTDVTESENSVFIDPLNADYILNSNNSTSWTGSTIGSVYGANYFQSSNAGIGWVGTPTGAGGANSGDPTTAIGLNGREYINFIDDPGGQGIAYSDNGTTWSTATVTANPGDLADKNHMWIDNKPTSPYEGNLYVAWTDFGGSDDSEIKFSRSVNDGVSWSTGLKLSAAINAGSHNQGVNIQTGPNGQVYVCWAIYDSWPSDETAIGFAKSTDGGVTFGAATRIITNIKGIRTTTVSKNHRVNSFPVMAVDISGGPFNGYIYIVWTNIGTPGTNTGTNASVYMSRSADGGTTWSTPIRVNQGTFADGKKSYFPWITCDPETGELSVIFYDDRNTSSSMVETWAAYSVDAGNNWTDFRVSDNAFTPAPISGLASSYMGDYLGITARGGKVYPCWTQPFNGQFMTFVSPFQLSLNAAFVANPTNICTGSTVTFTDVSSGPPLTWNWSFPGGTPSSYVGQTPPPVQYNAPGTYDVSLTVTDAAGNDTETKTGYITVKNVIADFSATPTSVVIGNTVTFTDQSACGPATWSWSFPGGTPSSYTGQTPPPITYNTLGTYDVSLTVAKAGDTDTKTRTGYITVAPPVFNMTNGTITTCTGDFYDSGGSAAIYSNNEVYVMTFYPSTPGAMLRFNFSAFNTELNYDTLTIYNGINSSAPMIGKYHGTTGPGIVTATNGNGALTFRFRSDVSLTYAGWAASISCIMGIVADPVSFTATPASTSQVNLAWVKNPAANDVMVVWNSTNTFGTPVDGTAYTAGSPIAGGGTVLYRGNLTSFNHSPLNPSTTYYYKAYSYSSSITYSTGLSASAATLCGISLLPFSENYPASTLPACWTKQISGTGAVDKWTVANSANAGGTAYEMMSTWQNINPATTRLVSPPINTSGMNQLNLSFKHFINAYGTGCTFRVQSSADGVNWTNEAWSIASSSSNVGPETVNTTVLSNLNSSSTYVAFIIEGNLYQYDYWYVDNVSITGNCITTNPVSVTISASANPVISGTSVTFTATPVNGGATPSYQWKVNGVNAGTGNPFTYTPANGDQVVCVLTSNANCITGNPATSNAVTMTVQSVPSTLTLGNMTVSLSQCYDALQTIYVGGTGTPFTVTPTGIVTLIAGQNIILYPGTAVQPGGYLLGYIAPTGPFCPPPTKEGSGELASGSQQAAAGREDFFRVYPNPTSGEFTLALDGYVPFEPVSVAVYDMKGNRITSVVMTNEMKRTFSLSSSPAGLYLVIVNSGYRNGSQRIVVDR